MDGSCGVGDWDCHLPMEENAFSRWKDSSPSKAVPVEREILASF